MGYFIETSLKELSEWEKRTLSFLLERMPNEMVQRLIEDYRLAPNDFHENAEQSHGVPPSLCNAIIGLATIRDLIESTEEPIPEIIPAEDSARMARMAFYAGMFIGMSTPGRGVEVLSLEVEHAEAKGRAKWSKEAINSRHAPLRDFKQKASDVAKMKWESGSTLLHHQMAKYLIEEYQDVEGRYPFIHLPGDVNASPNNVLLETVKKVAKDLKRFDLISGLPKKKY